MGVVTHPQQLQYEDKGSSLSDTEQLHVDACEAKAHACASAAHLLESIETAVEADQRMSQTRFGQICAWKEQSTEYLGPLREWNGWVEDHAELFQASGIGATYDGYGADAQGRQHRSREAQAGQGLEDNDTDLRALALRLEESRKLLVGLYQQMKTLLETEDTEEDDSRRRGGHNPEMRTVSRHDRTTINSMSERSHVYSDCATKAEECGIALSLINTVEERDQEAGKGAITQQKRNTIADRRDKFLEAEIDLGALEEWKRTSKLIGLGTDERAEGCPRAGCSGYGTFLTGEDEVSCFGCYQPISHTQEDANLLQEGKLQELLSSLAAMHSYLLGFHAELLAQLEEVDEDGQFIDEDGKEKHYDGEGQDLIGGLLDKVGQQAFGQLGLDVYRAAGGEGITDSFQDR